MWFPREICCVHTFTAISRQSENTLYIPLLPTTHIYVFIIKDMDGQSTVQYNVSISVNTVQFSWKLDFYSSYNPPDLVNIGHSYDVPFDQVVWITISCCIQLSQTLDSIIVPAVLPDKLTQLICLCTESISITAF